MSKSIAARTIETHELAKEKGWWPEKLTLAQDAAEVQLAVIAMQHLGLSTRLEAVRKGVSPPAMPTEDALRGFVALSSPRVVSFLAKLALVHSEISEATMAAAEGYFDAHTVDGKPEGAVIEMADAVIRMMDMAGGFSLDLEGAIDIKHAFNKTREHRHGGKLA